MLCTILGSHRVYIHGIHKIKSWDPEVCIASCDSNDKNRPEDDKSIVETCSLCNYLE